MECFLLVACGRKQHGSDVATFGPVTRGSLALAMLTELVSDIIQQFLALGCFQGFFFPPLLLNLMLRPLGLFCSFELLIFFAPRLTWVGVRYLA